MGLLSYTRTTPPMKSEFLNCKNKPDNRPCSFEKAQKALVTLLLALFYLRAKTRFGYIWCNFHIEGKTLYGALQLN